MSNRAVVRVLRPVRALARPSLAHANGTTFHCATPLRLCRRAVVQRRAQSTVSDYVKPAPTLYTAENPGKTALYDLHLRYGAKMVPFGGYTMPVQYSDLPVGDSHVWTREKASIFDVGHMVQYHLEGPGAEAFLELITPSGVQGLKVGQNTLSALLHPKTGGIEDDCIITRLEGGSNPRFYIVLNAGCRAKDYNYLVAALNEWHNGGNAGVQLQHLEANGEPFGLIALQGPLSHEILGSLLSKECKVDLNTWYFGFVKHITLALPTGESLPIVATRGGYTGEDGFELSIHPSQTVAVTEALLAQGGKDRVRLAGLGARDSLRLEAGMCLYGNDIDDSITLVEAALAWIIPKSRRGVGAKFYGHETILSQLTPKSKGGQGVTRRRCGLVVQGAPAREGAQIVDSSGETVGNVTSGCPSPSLRKNIAMAYVRDGLHKAGTELEVVVRGRRRPAIVTKMPFVPAKYVKEKRAI
ncbi:glycine cleavage system T protein [Piedraia hortae CBS 480.64]|uniref:Aminomethyltransferase n=1 Tax=Piedraia hortae CBS 480.64 TaxID=1314780 RepID=A0A6A7C4Z9_9PEZI|nr:glycine cleavage system T protein [Piedraia hortae CBS 480.64]